MSVSQEDRAMPHDQFLGALSLSAAPAHPRLDVFMLTGFLLAFFQIACYITRRQSRDMAIGLLLTCIGLAVYAIAAGVWPLAMVQCALTISAALRVTRRFRSQRRRRLRGVRTESAPVIPKPWYPESRMSRMFGPPGSIN
jgi:hypothetical protein